MVTFSIITPFYNGNSYIGNIYGVFQRNKESLKKTLPDAAVELIIVNDSPEIPAILPEGYDDSEVKVIIHKKNEGIHQARITGLSVSRGDYILFLDQDDEVADDFLVRQFSHLSQADVVVGGAYYENADGTRNIFYDKPPKLNKVLKLDTYLKAHNQIISPGQCLIRRTAIPSEWTTFVMKQNGSDDLFLWILMFEQGKRFTVNKECLYTHKYTGENLSESGVKMAKSSKTFTEYLRQIDYVDEQHIKTFERSRNLDIEMAEASGFNKITIAIHYLDIIMHRMWWKIKCL